MVDAPIYEFQESDEVDACIRQSIVESLDDDDVGYFLSTRDILSLVLTLGREKPGCIATIQEQDIDDIPRGVEDMQERPFRDAIVKSPLKNCIAS